MTRIDSPLRLGEILAEAVRIYGDRVAAALGIGLITAVAFLATSWVPAILAVFLAALTFTVCYAAATRVVEGDSLREALAQVLLRAPVLLVLTLVVSIPYGLALGLDAGGGLAQLALLFFAVVWLVLVGFSIPAAATERGEAGYFGRLVGPLSRSIELARADYFHAVGVVAALLLVYGILGQLLALALVGFADNGARASRTLVQVVLAPLFFLGLAVLYFEQRVRAVSSRG